MIKRGSIPLEIGAWMTPEGVELTAYADSSGSEELVSGVCKYVDLIDQELEACRMYGDKTSLFGQYDHHADLFVEALEEAAAYARKELEFRRA